MDEIRNVLLLRFVQTVHQFVNTHVIKFFSLVLLDDVFVERLSGRAVHQTSLEGKVVVVGNFFVLIPFAALEHHLQGPAVLLLVLRDL